MSDLYHKPPFLPGRFSDMDRSERCGPSQSHRSAGKGSDTGDICDTGGAGHVFATDCKRGLPGRGLSFLRSVCEAVHIPVYAIGGIGKENYGAVMAAGACIMSGLMSGEKPEEYIKEITNEV